MKRIIFISFCIVGLMLNSCEDEIPPIGDPLSKLDGINDSFVLTQVIQVDERAKIGSLMELDISEFFLGNASQEITFNSSDFTYSVVPGDSPNYLGDGGTWKFVNEEYPDQANDFPEKIVLISQGEEIELDMAQTILPTSETLEVKVVRSCSAKPAISYKLVFDRK